MRKGALFAWVAVLFNAGGGRNFPLSYDKAGKKSFSSPAGHQSLRAKNPLYKSLRVGILCIFPRSTGQPGFLKEQFRSMLSMLKGKRNLFPWKLSTAWIFPYGLSRGRPYLIGC